MSDIVLTSAQQKRVQAFRSQMEPLRLQLSALEQGVHAMLTTVVEMSGAADGVTYSLNEAGTMLIVSGGVIAPNEQGKE